MQKKVPHITRSSTFEMHATCSSCCWCSSSFSSSLSVVYHKVLFAVLFQVNTDATGNNTRGPARTQKSHTYEINILQDTWRRWITFPRQCCPAQRAKNYYWLVATFADNANYVCSKYVRSSVDPLARFACV